MIHDQRLVVITAHCWMLSACDAFQAVLKPPMVISWSAPRLMAVFWMSGCGRFPVPLSVWVTSAELYWSSLAKRGSGLGRGSAPADHHLVQFRGSDWLA